MRRDPGDEIEHRGKHHYLFAAWREHVNAFFPDDSIGSTITSAVLKNHTHYQTYNCSASLMQVVMSVDKNICTSMGGHLPRA